MKIWQAYVRGAADASVQPRARPPILLRDGFTWGGFVFGPFWLLLHGAWIPALLVAAGGIILRVAVHGPAALVLMFALSWIVGLFGQAMRGWSLRRRGWLLSHVIAAPDVDAATLRLLDQDPASRILVAA